MKKVVIDPGHGGTDPGATNGSYREKDFNLSISLKVRDYLLANYDVNVLMTRSTDKTMSLSERTQFANNNRGRLFLLHSHQCRWRNGMGKLYLQRKRLSIYD